MAHVHTGTQDTHTQKKKTHTKKKRSVGGNLLIDDVTWRECLRRVTTLFFFFLGDWGGGGIISPSVPSSRLLVKSPHRACRAGGLHKVHSGTITCSEKKKRKKRRKKKKKKKKRTPNLIITLLSVLRKQ